MERAAPKAAGLVAGELLHAVEHFFGGLVGEREEQDFPGLLQVPSHPSAAPPLVPAPHQALSSEPQAVFDTG